MRAPLTSVVLQQQGEQPHLDLQQNLTRAEGIPALDLAAVRTQPTSAALRQLEEQPQLDLQQNLTRVDGIQALDLAAM